MKKKMKSALTVMLTLALVSATAVAYTWATLVGAQMSDSQVNNFESPTAKVQISEDKFDGNTWGKATTDAHGLTKGGDNKYTTPVTSTKLDDLSELGKAKAENYTVGMAIPKNPMVKNNNNALDTTNHLNNATTTITTDEWLGLKIDYKIQIKNGSNYLIYSLTDSDSDGTLDTATAITSDTGAPTGGTISGNYYIFPNRSTFEIAIAKVSTDGTSAAAYTLYSADGARGDNLTEEASTDADGEATSVWRALDDTGTRFIWSHTVTAQNNTGSLFEYVVINNPITNTSQVIGDDTYYQITINSRTYWFKGYPAFQIDMTGYALQADGVAWSTFDGTSTYTNPAGAAMLTLMS